MDVDEMLEIIEGHLGCNWKDEYDGIDDLDEEDFELTLQNIVDEINADNKGEN